MRVVFMGTPDFAAASLQRLIEENYEIVAVFTQPDRPKGRGMELAISPVKALALNAGLPVYQPTQLKDGAVLSVLSDLHPDIIVVVAYGKILSKEILDLPPLGCINVHGSLLPKYRGSAPIQWAVLNGDRVTGVSTIYLTEKMDAGDVIYSMKTEIGETETSGDLFDRLMLLGAELLHRTLIAIENGTAPRIPQDESNATYTVRLDKTMSPIDWNRTPRQIAKWIYGLQPWPVATVKIGTDVFRVFKASYSNKHTTKRPGSIVSAGDEGISFACAGGETLLITELQAPGKKRMSAADYLRGHPLQVD